MESGTTVLGLLRQARELLKSGESESVIAAISSLRDRARARTRDLAYFAVMDTIELGGGAASIAALSGEDGRAGALSLIDATIRRISASLH